MKIKGNFMIIAIMIINGYLMNIIKWLLNDTDYNAQYSFTFCR
jgi:hypothetical protein